MVMVEQHGVFSVHYKTYYLVAFMIFIGLTGLLGGILVSIDAWNACDKKIDERAGQRSGVAISAAVFGAITIILLVIIFLLHEDK